MRIIALIFLVFSICAATVLADGSVVVQQPTPIIRTEVSLVNVTLTAKDKRGNHVEGLTADDFIVYEDRQLQKVEYFSELSKTQETPLTIVFLIDTSASVRDKLKYEKTTAAEFFRQLLRPNKDLAAIIQFDSDVNLVQDFTQSQTDLLNALDSLKPGQSTTLYDAIYLAAEEKLKGEVGRKMMVVITDGDDSASKIRKEEAIAAAQKNDVVIYGIGVRSNEYPSNFGVLKEFAEDTGGEFFSPRATQSEIRSAFQSIKDEIQGQYSLAYRSTNILKNGTYRTIDVRCKASGVRVRARKGYFAPKEQRADLN